MQLMKSPIHRPFTRRSWPVLLLAGGLSAVSAADTPSASAGVTLSGEAKGKVVIVTDVNGAKQTRVLELAGGQPVVIDADGLGAGEVTSPTWLGVATEPVGTDVAAQVPVPAHTGLVVRQVMAGSPAAAAGLQELDVLAKLDDQILITPRQLSVLIGNLKAGDSVKLSYFRKGQPAQAIATLADRPATAANSAQSPIHLEIDGQKADIRPFVSMIRSFVAENADVAAILRQLGGKGAVNFAEAFDALPADARDTLEAHYHQLLGDSAVPADAKDLLRRLAEGTGSVDLAPLLALIDSFTSKDDKVADALKKLVADSGVDLAKAFADLPQDTRSSIEGQYNKVMADPIVPEAVKSVLRDIADGREPSDLKPLVSIVRTFMTTDGQLADVIGYLGKDGGIDFAKTFESLPPDTRRSLEDQYHKLLEDPTVPEEAKAVLRSLVKAVEHH